jgi:hypothetical protein
MTDSTPAASEEFGAPARLKPWSTPVVIVSTASSAELKITPSKSDYTLGGPIVYGGYS